MWLKMFFFSFLWQRVGIEKQHLDSDGGVHVPAAHRGPPRDISAPGAPPEGGGFLHLPPPRTGERTGGRLGGEAWLPGVAVPAWVALPVLLVPCLRRKSWLLGVTPACTLLAPVPGLFPPQAVNSF